MAANANTREPPGEYGPTEIPDIVLQKNEAGSFTLTLWEWTEDDGWQKKDLTGKIIEFRAKCGTTLLPGTWVIWDNSSNGGLTLSNQTTNKGECVVAFTSAKGTTFAGVFVAEAWNSTSNEERKHYQGHLVVQDSGGPA